MKHFRIFVIVMATILLVACDNSDDQATGSGDALIVAKQLNDTTVVYGISLYAYSLSPFASINAVNTANPDSTFKLTANQGYKTSFYYETPDNKFTTAKPAAGTFTFSAIFENGVTHEFQNTLTDKVLPIPHFEKYDYNTNDHQLDVKWTLINGASSYSISIFSGSEIIFGSPELKKDGGTYAIKASGVGWAKDSKPESGKTYTVRLFAYLYEPGGNVYTIQASSIAEKSVEWGD